MQGSISEPSEYFLKPLYLRVCVSIHCLVLWCRLTSKDQEPYTKGSAKCVALSRFLPVRGSGPTDMCIKCIFHFSFCSAGRQFFIFGFSLSIFVKLSAKRTYTKVVPQGFLRHFSFSLLGWKCHILLLSSHLTFDLS